MSAERRGRTYVTEVRRRDDLRLTIGAVVPPGSRIRSVTLDGDRVRPDLVRTSRGLEVRVGAGSDTGTSRLVIRLR